MEFDIILESDNKSYEKKKSIDFISQSLAGFLKNRSYGEDVETFLIGFVAIKTKPGYEEWYKERKPKYIDYRLTKSRLTGLPLETIKQYSYDIKFDYELYDEFVNGTEEESSKLLARKILDSFSHLDKLPKKIKDFDKDKFKSDVEEFFKSNNLLS
ncbi:MULTISPECIES: hypothetical protein [Empedobacter]|uniref:hypothetical protein n=1 Tax=Empedobacter TaxID=59734 RepID=UPI001C8ED9DD|nr:MULTISPECIES: hypothetical protein [Empedobacter]MBY0067110.1 hypothetical protein [Empedobacter falsenii]